MLKHFMVLAVGITSGFWVRSRQTRWWLDLFTCWSTYIDVLWLIKRYFLALINENLQGMERQDHWRLGDCLHRAVRNEEEVAKGWYYCSMVMHAKTFFCKNIWRSVQYFLARCLRHLQVEEGQTWGATCLCLLLLRSMPGKQHRDKEAVMIKAIKTTTSKQIQITSSVMPGKLTNNTKISRPLWRPKHKQQEANTSNISSTSDPSQCSSCPNK